MWMPSNDQNMRIAVPSDVKEKWDEMLVARGISQQRAAVALVRWILEQDPLTQLMIFGQAPQQDHGALVRIVLERLAKAGKKRAG